jgi:GNAT superfamily N-acetyltransferase
MDADGTGVRRVDDRLGLAVCRVALSGRSLVTYARDHVMVRTPSRPDFHDGNTLDLESPPAPEALAGWVERFHRTVGTLGAQTVQLRWEEPAGVAAGAATGDAPAGTEGAAATGDAPAGTEDAAGAPLLPPALAAAARDRQLAVTATSVLLLDRLVDPPPADAQLVPIAPPSAVAGGVVDRRWHAATVLYRYETGTTPDDWRDHDEDFVGWAVEVQRELAAAERAQVWLALRHGAPVGRLTFVDDRQGLAIIEDVIVHPVHRRQGIAAALTAKALATHLAVAPDTRIGIGAEPGSSAERLYRRLGFRPHALVWTLRSTVPPRPGDPADQGPSARREPPAET